MSTATEPFRDGNEQLQDVVSSSTLPIRVVIERTSEEIQKDVEMMGTLDRPLSAGWGRQRRAWRLGVR